MTIDEYRAKFGADLKKHESEGWFVGLIALLNDQHLLKTFRDSVGDNLLLQGAPIYLNQIFGFDKCLEVISKVRAEQPTKAEEPPSDYQNEK